jgi:hypothetical protein
MRMQLKSWHRGLIVAAAGVGTLAACATADLRPGVVKHESLKQIREKFHGPDVSVRVLWGTGRNRGLITPTVSVADSAFVVIGNIADNGTLRIIYPLQPGDSNLVRDTGHRFTGPTFSPEAVVSDSYWGQTRNRPPVFFTGGSVFVIASSTPLKLDKLAEGQKWSVFDVYYRDGGLDPRAAVTDLAAAISPDVTSVSIAYVSYESSVTVPGQYAMPLTPYGSRRRPPPE